MIAIEIRTAKSIAREVILWFARFAMNMGLTLQKAPA